MVSKTVSIKLVGPGGEPVDIRRTLSSHGLAELPPLVVDPSYESICVTMLLPETGAQTVSATAARDSLRVSLPAQVTAKDRRHAIAAIRNLLNLDLDLATFYAQASEDADLAWVANGAGRMVRCGSVFEAVVKTICTTNCNWGATVKMVRTLVATLGDVAPGDGESWQHRTFPDASVMAARPESFYREVVRAGYRSPYLIKLAQDVESGDTDLERYATRASADVDDDTIIKELLQLPGVGPYAAAHIMMLLGRHSQLILDSWTRPTYAKLLDRESVTDAEIIERFAPYGQFAGLAFWLFITRDWIEQSVS